MEIPARTRLVTLRSRASSGSKRKGIGRVLMPGTMARRRAGAARAFSPKFRAVVQTRGNQRLHDRARRCDRAAQRVGRAIDFAPPCTVPTWSRHKSGEFGERLSIPHTGATQPSGRQGKPCGMRVSTRSARHVVET
jgi:hypothetical protein